MNTIVVFTQKDMNDLYTILTRNGYVIFTNTHDAKQAQNALNNVDYEYNGVKMKLQIECYNYNNTHYHHHQQQPCCHLWVRVQVSV